MLQTDDIFTEDLPCCPGCGAERPEACDCHADDDDWIPEDADRFEPVVREAEVAK